MPSLFRPAWRHAVCRGRALFASFQRLLQPQRSRDYGYLLSRCKRRELIRQRIEEESGHDADVCSERQPARRELTLQVLESVFRSGEGIRDVRYRARPRTIVVGLHILLDRFDRERERVLRQRRRIELDLRGGVPVRLAEDRDRDVGLVAKAEYLRERSARLDVDAVRAGADDGTPIIGIDAALVRRAE